MGEELGDAKILTCATGGVVMAFTKMEETGQSRLEGKKPRVPFWTC